MSATITQPASPRVTSEHEQDPAYCAARDRLVGHLDRIREDCLMLIGQLEDLKRAQALLVATPAVAEYEAEAVAAAVVRQVDLSGTMNALRADLDAHPGVARRWSAGAEAVHDDLHRLLDRLELDRLPALDKLLSGIVERCAELVVPVKLNDRLKEYRVGKPLDFNREFDREIPDAAMRERVLKRLIAQQGRIHGIVDVEQGLVYKQSPSVVYRVFTYLSPLLFTAVAVGVLVGLEQLDLPAAWNLGDALLPTFALVLVGTIGHLLFESAKQYQLDNIPITPITQGLDWLHLRWVGVAQTFVWMLVVVFGLRLLDTDPGSEALLCIAAGYSLDSVAGLFITRFQQLAASGRKDLEARLKPAAT